jgi:hypothetical protein
MIKPNEIKQKAEKLYSDFLVSFLTNEPFFPKQIRTNKGKKDEFVNRYEGYEKLNDNSKTQTGFGYSIVFKTINKKGEGKVPILDKIYFENEYDFLKYINKSKDFETFKNTVNKIKIVLPLLENWILKNPLKITKYEKEWNKLIDICLYFLNDYNDEKYLRELPIDSIDTKYIENNKSIIDELLHAILPEDKINKNAKKFENKFYLKSEEELIFIRILDKDLFIDQKISHLKLPVSEFNKLQIDCEKVFITENKMNCLTFPNVKNSIVIFGKGYEIDIIKNADWLTNKKIYYWGDIDTHGLNILSRIRTFYKQTISVLMNLDTFNKPEYKDLKGKEGKPEFTVPEYLTTNEIELFEFLLMQYKQSNFNRLEQERLKHCEIEEYIKREID